MLTAQTPAGHIAIAVQEKQYQYNVYLNKLNVTYIWTFQAVLKIVFGVCSDTVMFPTHEFPDLATLAVRGMSPNVSCCRR